MIVTTSLRSCPADVEIACRFASAIGEKYSPREERPISELQLEQKEFPLVIIENRQPVIYLEKTRFFFHRGMAELRILNFCRTGHDPMIDAMGLTPGMSVLDCTLGLATDALMTAFVAGPAGKVAGLEASPIVAEVVRLGLAELAAKSSDVRPETRLAATRIAVIHADHREYLRELPDNSFDVVYFDPMFRQTKPSSAGIQPLRKIANASELCPDTIRQAARISRKRVVVKESRGSREFARLGIGRIGGGRYSAVQYGMIVKEELP